MSELTFTNANIAMATNETTGNRIVWDKDTDTFGSGPDVPSALVDLANNYDEAFNDVAYTGLTECPACGSEVPRKRPTEEIDRQEYDYQCPRCGVVWGEA